MGRSAARFDGGRSSGSEEGPVKCIEREPVPLGGIPCAAPASMESTRAKFGSPVGQTPPAGPHTSEERTRLRSQRTGANMRNFAGVFAVESRLSALNHIHHWVRATFQFEMFRLKDLAPKNMDSMSVTFAVFQAPMGWLNTSALSNMPCMSVTLEVFQLPMG
jgi:hypothetical protein